MCSHGPLSLCISRVRVWFSRVSVLAALLGFVPKIQGPLNQHVIWDQSLVGEYTGPSRILIGPHGSLDFGFYLDFGFWPGENTQADENGFLQKSIPHKIFQNSKSQEDEFFSQMHYESTYGTQLTPL